MEMRDASIGISALLEQDLSSFEYYHSQPRRVQEMLENMDVSSFDDMQDAVERLRSYQPKLFK